MSTVSIITPVAGASPKLLKATIDSVMGQSCRDWQLCIVDDASPSAEVSALLRNLPSGDGQLRVEWREHRGGPAQASNDGLALADGAFVAVVKAGDILVKEAVASLCQTVRERPEADYCYSDEAEVTPSGRIINPFYKPDWSPERMRTQLYTGRVSAIRRTLASALGGFRSEFDGCHDLELALRVSENTKNIVHVPEVLYLCHVGQELDEPGTEPTPHESRGRAIAAHCDRVGIDGVVEPLASPGSFRVRRQLHRAPVVSIVIPTRGSASAIRGVHRIHVLHALTSVLERSTYQNIEVVIVPDRETPSTVITGIEELCGDRLRLEWWDGPFNFSAKVNAGVAASSGDVVLLLNDDVEVLTADWIETLIGFAQEPDCGLVGCKLLTAFETLQHGGHVYGSGVMLHAYANYPGDERGMADLLSVDRECAGVTAACAATRRDVWERVGGMCEALPLNYNDVDLSLKVRSLGLRAIWTPHAVLYHFESLTRVRKNEVSPSEVDFLDRRWHSSLQVDPYSNPNLDQRRGDWVVRRPAEHWVL